MNGGVTNLANYNSPSDETLFLNLPSDPLDDPIAPTSTLTPLDLTELSAIGFDDTTVPSLTRPTAIPTLTSSGSSAVNVQNVSVAQNAATPASSLLRSVTVPAGDTIAYYGFFDGGGSGGHLALNGVAQPDGRFVYVLDTQLNSLQYVGGTAAGSESISVIGFNYDTNALTPVSQLTATTTAARASAPPPSGNPGVDPAAVAINAAAIFGFANVGTPTFTAAVNQDGAADLARGSGLSPAFIGGYVAGIEIRVMANLEQAGVSTAQINGQFAHDLDSIGGGLLTAGSVAEGFGFLSGLTTGGPTGVGAPPGLQADIQAALGTDQQAAQSVYGAILGATAFTQAYANGIGGGAGPLAALHGAESTALL